MACVMFELTAAWRSTCQGGGGTWSRILVPDSLDLARTVTWKVMDSAWLTGQRTVHGQRLGLD